MAARTVSVLSLGFWQKWDLYKIASQLFSQKYQEKISYIL